SLRQEGKLQAADRDWDDFVNLNMSQEQILKLRLLAEMHGIAEKMQTVAEGSPERAKLDDQYDNLLPMVDALDKVELRNEALALPYILGTKRMELLLDDHDYLAKPDAPPL